MKLLKLLPNQVMEHWDSIKLCIQNALPTYADTSDVAMLEVQSQILIGQIECWAGVNDTIDSNIFAVMTTKFVYDDSTKAKNLLIYTLSITSDYPADMWVQAAQIMRSYARANGCKMILAYSNVASIIDVSKSLGADVSYHFITFSL